ncbi:MAG: CDP-alcohol phosphatidyltransferase family protein [Myxococcales bacterium]|nr:CDP-alcohol phosphatidyltransferase family protein [Myxococcales bacterium]
MTDAPVPATIAIDLRDDGEAWFADVCGLRNVVRLLCALQHAGIAAAHVVGPEADRGLSEFAKHPLFKRAGDEALVVHVGSELPSTPTLIFRKAVVLSSATVKALLAQGCTEVPTSLPPGVPGFLAAASTAEERQIATRTVLGSVGKPMLHSGMASVYLLQPIAKVLNRPLCHTPITPNQITILGFLLGLATLPLLWDGRRSHVILAVSLLFVANLLDQIDGQLARIKFQFSSYGEKLDHYLDEIIKVLLLAPIGMGLYHANGQELWMYAGWGASGAQLFYTLAMFYYLFRFGGKNASSTNFKFWYGVKPRSAASEAPRPPEDPNTIKARFFLRKDFVHTMFFVFGVAGFLQAPFMLTAFGAFQYGSTSLIQLVFFHRKVQIGNDYHGGV